MKKCLKLALSLILLLSGCQAKSSLSLEELNKELPYLSEEGFDINHVLSRKNHIILNLIINYIVTFLDKTIYIL